MISSMRAAHLLLIASLLNTLVHGLPLLEGRSNEESGESISVSLRGTDTWEVTGAIGLPPHTRPATKTCDACDHDDSWPSVTGGAYTTGGIASSLPSAACTPNFQGALLHVTSASSNASWCVLGDNAPEPGYPLEAVNGSMTTFRIERTGQPAEDFIIKLGGIGNNSLILTGATGSGLTLTDYKGSGNPSFHISCQSCAELGEQESPVSGQTKWSGCTIMDSAGGSCLTENNGTLSLGAGSGSNGQYSSGEERYGSSSGTEGGSGSSLFDIVAA